MHTEWKVMLISLIKRTEPELSKAYGCNKQSSGSMFIVFRLHNFVPHTKLNR